MGTVTITGNVYNIYDTQANAVIYLTGSITSQAAGFLAASADSQAKSLVAAARELDAVLWAGKPVAAVPVPQPLQWPRTGVTRADGTAVDPGSIPPEVIQASFELASLLLAKPGLFDQVNADSNIQSVTAGPTGVTFFKPIAIGKFPPSVGRLISQFIGGAAAVGGSEKLGGCAESQFDDCDTYGLNRGV